jgi:hypothetical protein
MSKSNQITFGKAAVKEINLPTDHIELLWRSLMFGVGSFAILFVLKYAF